MNKSTSIVLLLIATLFITSCTPNSPLTLNVATYNIRMDTPADSLDPWSKRQDMIKGLIAFHDFDIFGTQEGFKHQLDDLTQGTEFDYIGVGRGDGIADDEHSAIFYNKNRFELLQNGDFWFSETPDTPSKGWDATCCNRICSWGEFKEKETGKVFFFFNSHYDHEGAEARRNSSLLLLERIREIAGTATTFVTGDFNAIPSEEPMQIIYNDGYLHDSYQVSEQPPYGTLDTFNAFNIHHRKSDRIDYIWVTPDVTVHKYGVLNEIQYGHFPSDHYPVMVRVTIQ